MQWETGTDPPSATLHPLGFWGLTVLQVTEDQTEKGDEEKKHKESNRRCPISPEEPYLDFSATPQDGLLN